MSQTSKDSRAVTRLAALFDDGAFVEIDAENESGAKAGYGSISGGAAFVYCQDSSVLSGAMDEVSMRKWAHVYDLAAKTGAPVVTVYDSQGFKVDGGFAALSASSAMLGKVSALSGVVPQIAVVLGCCAGTAALAASMADVCVMSQKGELFLTPSFTDKAQGGKTKGVGSADYAQKAGVASIVCADETEALQQAAAVLGLLPANNLAALPLHDSVAPSFTDKRCPIEDVCDEGSVIELYKEMGNGARTALATLGGMPCGLIASRVEFDRGDTAKCARLVELCDAFNLPVISFLDSTGFVRSAESDVCEGIRSAARLSHVLAEATTSKITVVTGSATGAIYSVFCGQNAGCDLSFAWDGAVISALAPEAAVSLLWANRVKNAGDIETLAAEYAATEASGIAAAKAGAIGEVIQREQTRERLIGALDMLASKRVSRLPKKHGNMPL